MEQEHTENGLEAARKEVIQAETEAKTLWSKAWEYETLAEVAEVKRVLGELPSKDVDEANQLASEARLNAIKAEAVYRQKREALTLREKEG